MAVLPDLPGIRVTICVDGQQLTEYNDDEDEIEIESTEVEKYKASRTVSKYVESTTGKEFSIEIRVGPPYMMDCELLSFEVEIDGCFICAPILKETSYHRQKSAYGDWIKRIKRVEVSRNLEENTSTVRSLVFSAVGTTSDDDKLERVKEDSKHMARIGKISVTVQRERNPVPIISPRPKTRNGLDGDSVTNVHEKALKGSAKSHGTSLGSVAQVPMLKYCKPEVIDRLRPLAIYVFKYRSRAALKTLLILPRTPESNIALDDLTKDQRSRVEAFVRGIVTGEGSSRIKRENPESATSGRDKKTRTTDKGKEKAKIPVFDLTGDSD